ncbi:DUF7344 domain-containing protein [Halostagnicola kamekurae]|uniref:DUF7344 domain-containing protein n=1 Tax=Halostagnicola kamekurae TaxID=619731 RepID=A0A1I6QM94_9EURY|nr:hypothetical protein [Halostagnicola kamekurae]SFS53510.1 hypothetical protein SAMN04488556_1367 [Halostagnicola kamekurae]
MKSTYISSEEQGERDEDIEGDAQAETDTVTSADESFPKDEIFHLLQNERRRLVLEYLRQTEGPVRMRDVAEQVAAWEHETTVEELTSTQRQRVYIPLYQSHLSKLDKAGIIDYQQNRGIVERKPLADTVDRYLQVDPTTDEQSDEEEAESNWDDSYLGATVLCYVLLLGAVFELPVVSIISGIGLSALILLTFTLLTVRRIFE